MNKSNIFSSKYCLSGVALKANFVITGVKDLYVDTFNPGDFPDEGGLSVNYQLTVKVRFYSKKIAGTYIHQEIRVDAS